MHGKTFTQTISLIVALALGFGSPTLFANPIPAANDTILNHGIQGKVETYGLIALKDVTVVLNGANGLLKTTLTNSRGNYAFTSLPNSTYQVYIQAPFGYVIEAPSCGWYYKRLEDYDTPADFLLEDFNLFYTPQGPQSKATKSSGVYVRFGQPGGGTKLEAEDPIPYREPVLELSAMGLPFKFYGFSMAGSWTTPDNKPIRVEVKAVEPGPIMAVPYEDKLILRVNHPRPGVMQVVVNPSEKYFDFEDSRGSLLYLVLRIPPSEWDKLDAANGVLCFCPDAGSIALDSVATNSGIPTAGGQWCGRLNYRYQ